MVEMKRGRKKSKDENGEILQDESMSEEKYKKGREKIGRKVNVRDCGTIRIKPKTELRRM